MIPAVLHTRWYLRLWAPLSIALVGVGLMVLKVNSTPEDLLTLTTLAVGVVASFGASLVYVFVGMGEVE